MKIGTFLTSILLALLLVGQKNGAAETARNPESATMATDMPAGELDQNAAAADPSNEFGLGGRG